MNTLHLKWLKFRQLEPGLTFVIKKELLLEPAENFSSDNPEVLLNVRSCRKFMKLRRAYVKQINVREVLKEIERSINIDRSFIDALRAGQVNTCLISGPRLEEPGCLAQGDLTFVPDGTDVIAIRWSELAEGS